MRRLFCLVALALALATPQAGAQGPGPAEDAVLPPLQPADVAASAALHYPEVIRALAERRGAAAELLQARGAFDTVFEVEGQSYAAGFYDGQVAQAKVSRPFGPLGSRVYGSYKLSDGTFPIYEDQFFTNEAGEFKLGVLFSLLRDRAIDERRFGVADARLALEQAEFDVLLTRVGVQQQALLAYWRWVAAAQEFGVYRDLLALAEERVTGLEREVERGARAAIFLTENAQNLTRRQVLVEQARRDLALAANDLSLFYRGPDGAPIVPDPERVPEDIPLPPVSTAAPLPAVLTRRPELGILAAAADRARGRIALAENELKPRLDLRIEGGNDFGPIAEGTASRDPAEAIIGLQFQVPLGRRVAKGQIAKAEAELRAIEQERRLAQDRIVAELREIVLSLEAAAELVRLAAQEREQAATMVRAEQRRFEAGASDFFLVNLREEALADARVRYARSLFALNAARATYDAAVIDLDRLGIDPSLIP